MRYNERSYYRANPFYQQGFLPDISLFNRKPPQCFSEIPQGDQFFTEVGRKHYNSNLSEIGQTQVLTSPERYPYEHRIALDKNYPRNLDTLDIEGAASSTLVSQAIKNKIRAQEQIARRHQIAHTSLDNTKQKTLEEKRRLIATKQYEEAQNKLNRMSLDSLPEQQSPSSKNKQSHIQQINQEPSGVSKEFKRYIQQYSNHKYPLYNHKPIGIDQTENHTQRSDPNYSRMQDQYSHQQSKRQYQTIEHKEQMSINNRYKSNPQYKDNFQVELKRRKEDKQQTQQINQSLKSVDFKQLRRVNPTNLSSSFNAAAHQIIGI